MDLCPSMGVQGHALPKKILYILVLCSMCNSNAVSCKERETGVQRLLVNEDLRDEFVAQLDSVLSKAMTSQF